MVKPREMFHSALEEPTNMKDNNESNIEEDKESADPGDLNCADIVKKGPDHQGPSPLVMGGAESHPGAACRVTQI